MSVRTHVDLFSGIGGFALAAKRNGVQTVVFCENEKFCIEGLKRAWGLPVVDDVRRFDGTKWRGTWLLTFGCPCQPASRAGQQRGSKDDRWLWDQAIRIVQESGPAWFIGENPPGIGDLADYGIALEVDRNGGAVGNVGDKVHRTGPGVFHKILEALEKEGYEVQPLSIPACAVDSPQDRERIWIVGHRQREQSRSFNVQSGGSKGTFDGFVQSTQSLVADSECEYARRAVPTGRTQGAFNGVDRSSSLGDWSEYDWLECPDGKGGTVLRRAPVGLYNVAHGIQLELLKGVCSKLLEGLGNAIVPQVAAEIIGAMIQAEENPKIIP